MKTRLSNTSVSLYLECGLKYDLHYNKKIRPLKTKSALVFGSAIDSAFNALLKGNTLENARTDFNTTWLKYETDSLITYSKSDLDQDLLKSDNVKDSKNESWESLLLKGQLMIDTYHEEVMPRIKKILAVQKPFEIANNEGDTAHGFIDMILQWEDGKTYIADNKTSSVKYEPTSAKDNRQLPTYYYAVKDEYKPHGVMYIVFDKKINLNKVKTCKICDTICTTSHKTCNALNPGIGRCGGEFLITMDPKATYNVIINQIDESDENRVLAEFDTANQGISNGVFEANESSCVGKYGKCQYWSLCRESSMDGLIKK